METIDIKRKVGQQIRAARKSKGFTLKELGEKVGVAESTFSLYEGGKQNLTIETLQKIATALEIEVVDFFK